MSCALPQVSLYGKGHHWPSWCVDLNGKDRSSPLRFCSSLPIAVFNRAEAFFLSLVEVADITQDICPKSEYLLRSHVLVSHLLIAPLVCPTPVCVF